MGTKLPATAAGGGEGNPGFSQVHSAACATLRAADAGPGAWCRACSMENNRGSTSVNWHSVSLVKLHPPWNQNTWEVLSFS